MISEATVIFWYRVGWQTRGSGESLLFTLTLHTVNENIRSRLMMARNLRENKSPIEKDEHGTVMGFALAERHTSALVSSLRRTLSHRHFEIGVLDKPVLHVAGPFERRSRLSVAGSQSHKWICLFARLHQCRQSRVSIRLASATLPLGCGVLSRK